MLHCPACNGRVVILNPAKMVMPFLNLEPYAAPAALCLHCPVASEINLETGTLRDLGKVTIQMLYAPYNGAQAPQRLGSLRPANTLYLNES